MITEYYILMGVVAVFGWLFILNWDEGMDAHTEPEQDETERIKDFKEKLIKDMRNDI